LAVHSVLCTLRKGRHLHEVGGDAVPSQSGLEFHKTRGFCHGRWDVVPQWNGPRVVGELVVIGAGGDMPVSHVMVLPGGHVDGDEVEMTFYCNELVGGFVHEDKPHLT